MSLASERQVTTNRNKRPAPRGSAAYPRKRAITACQVCRSRRTKCDNQRPICGFCAKTGATCNYASASEDYSAYDSASLRILERLDDLEVLLRKPSQQLGGSESTAPVQPAAAVWSPEDIDRSWLLPVGPDQLLLSTTNEFERLSHPVHAVAVPTATPESLSATSVSAVADLDTSSSKQLLDNFFNYVHVKNPILQEDTTRRMVSQLCLYGADWKTESCLALLICALGSIATPLGASRDVGPGSSAYVKSQSYFLAAQRRLGNCLVRSGVLESQCLFLAGVYEMCMFKPFDAWRLFSQALSCCQSFTFLRDQTAVSPVIQASEGDNTIENIHIAEQSIYWSAWKSELELRNHWKMPDFSNSQPGVLYPPFFPTPPSPERYYEEDDLGGARAERENVGWYFYLAEISLKRLLSRMSDEILRFQPQEGTTLIEGLAETLLNRANELEQWVQALPDPITLSTDPEADDVCKFVLRGQLINAYELLYWPFLSYYVLRGSPKQNDLRQDSLEPPTDDYIHLAETALEWHEKRLRTNYPGFYHRHHGTWFMILSCTRSVLMLLKAYKFNLINEFGYELAMPNGWQLAVDQGMQLNAFWSHEASDAQRRHPILMKLCQDLNL